MDNNKHKIRQGQKFFKRRVNLFSKCTKQTSHWTRTGPVKAKDLLQENKDSVYIVSSEELQKEKYTVVLVFGHSIPFASPQFVFFPICAFFKLNIFISLLFPQSTRFSKEALHYPEPPISKSPPKSSPKVSPHWFPRNSSSYPFKPRCLRGHSQEKTRPQVVQ